MKQSRTLAMVLPKVLAAISAIFIVCTLQAHSTESANILGLFTSHSPSHLIVHMSVAKALAEKGHNVTVVCGTQPKVTHRDINVIIIPPSEADEKHLNQLVADTATKKNSFLNTMFQLVTSMSGMIDMQLKIVQDKRFTEMYTNPDTKFDLVIMGYFMNDFLLGVAAKFECPIIVNWMGPPNMIVDEYVGNPAEVAYVPMMNIAVKAGEKMTFLQRVQNLLTAIFFRIFTKLLDFRINNYYNELFGNDKNVPSLNDMKKNVSAVFCNYHFSEGPIRPNVPAAIEIGGIQIKDQPDPLPKDVEEFLDFAKPNGAILFSLGSNLKSDNVKPETVQIIFKVLSSLKQNIIWKWEDLDNTPGQSTNILYKKWLPQDDILAHPNLKLFITHAGKGGIAESQYHAVPMLALPVFADQPGNADKIELSGYGLKLDILNLAENELKEAILEVINNPKYYNNIKKFSKLYRDRPLTAKQNVVFWTEYILRHYGAQHMQSPLVHMNTMQSLNLDVYGFIVVVLYCVWRLLKFLANLLYGKTSKTLNKNPKTTKDKLKQKKIKKQ